MTTMTAEQCVDNNPFGIAGRNMDDSLGVEYNGLDLPSVHPRNGAKYSPNLYKWLTNRNKKHRAWTSRVYRDADGTLWIGMLDRGDLFGAKLYGVLCNGSKEGCACWVNLRGLVEVPDFWRRYVSEGRCAIDPEHKTHFIGDGSRWTQDGDTRACLWCGKAQQTLTRWTEAVQRQEWRTTQTSADPIG